MALLTKSVVILLGVVAHQVVCSIDTCASLVTSISIPNTTIIAHNYLPNGTNIALPGTVESCGGPDLTVNSTADLCRLVLVVSTTASSEVQLEAWLPDPEIWNGRLLATGNGGIGGCIDYATMQNGAGLGFAAFGTNAGHNGSVGYEFFLNQPEVINNFGHRAIHVEAEVGKELVRQYYGTEATKNYYAGCSTGGRQGFQNANLYPEDFDGLLLGSPGINWLHIVASKGILARRIGWPFLNSSAYVRPEQWSAIVEAQIRQLDPLDGVVDGIIDEPTKHRFDPMSLACGAGVLNGSMCLSPQQIESVRKAYEPIASTSGQIVYPAFELGSKTDVFSENQKNGTAQLSYTILQDFWRGAIYNDSNWTPNSFSESDMDFALETNPGQVNADDTDLSSFHRRGGKIISYHGRNDETVTSALSEQFFVGVQSALNLTLEEIHDFYRLFFLPGMHHCSGGLGAWSIGNAQKYPYDKKLLDPDHNALLALVEWVENGAAPKTLIGTKYENDSMGGSIIAQRTYCPYPIVSKWNKVNDTSLATSWDCVLPEG
ncbi:tannase and feruloyl esterase [Annulohypoxylon maeteangense]|uniref:tannase and feruloyl esterase n=1 Tax=Annulohypoxylon maeteangense TaxID=1927788 RepID=UPI002007C6CC|nr:tannase and feruloyl esterase [Annulohypoxylon maeteangense]KAI0884954.1 tannase and feruloyl esterase [Annulohypoxylon maeteangense]